MAGLVDPERGHLFGRVGGQLKEPAVEVDAVGVEGGGIRSQSGVPAHDPPAVAVVHPLVPGDPVVEESGKHHAEQPGEERAGQERPKAGVSPRLGRDRAGAVRQGARHDPDNSLQAGIPGGCLIYKTGWNRPSGGGRNAAPFQCKRLELSRHSRAPLGLEPGQTDLVGHKPLKPMVILVLVE